MFQSPISWTTKALTIFFFTIAYHSAQAASFESNLTLDSALNSSLQAKSGPSSYLLAQADPDEAFDPFADYSEFDEASDEEADLNFFKNGRFFTLGFAFGLRTFTGNFASIYSTAPNYGVYLTYFFDLRSSFMFGLSTGDHPVSFETYTDSYSGNVSFTAINFDYKHYFNTQNVTRGLADLNPYILGGFTQFYRSYSLSKIEGLTRDQTMGLDFGGGIEIPLARKKGFVGIQTVYRYVNFNDENKSYIQGTELLKKKISGDIFDITAILGLNY